MAERGCGRHGVQADEHHHDADTSAVITGKIIAMLVLGGVSCVLAFMPRLLDRYFKWSDNKTENERHPSQFVLSLLFSFGGGSLLATTFLHMLPEVHDSIEQLQADGRMNRTNYHLPEVIVCCGFFLMYLLEEVVHVYLHSREVDDGDQGEVHKVLHRTLSVRKCSEMMMANAGERQAVTSDGLLVETGRVCKRQIEEEIGKKISVIDCNLNEADWKENGAKEMFSDCEGKQRIKRGTENNTASDTDMYCNANTKLSNVLIPDDVITDPGIHTVSMNHCDDHHRNHSGSSHGFTHFAGENRSVSSFRGLFVVLALSVHELFEGLAVGLQRTPQLVYYMLGSVAAHKLVLSFCVGMELVAIRTRLPLFVTYVLTFAMVSPLGIGIGITSNVGENLVNSILQGLAAGTLLYVVFFEVLERARKVEQSGIYQSIFTFAGFGLMFALFAVSE